MIQPATKMVDLASQRRATTAVHATVDYSKNTTRHQGNYFIWAISSIDTLRHTKHSRKHVQYTLTIGYAIMDKFITQHEINWKI